MCNMCEAKVVLPSQAEHIGNVLWHPTADGVLAASFGRTVAVFDVCAAGCKFGLWNSLFYWKQYCLNNAANILAILFSYSCFTFLTTVCILVILVMVLL